MFLAPAGEPQARTVEFKRLEESYLREANWKRWGPYLAERQWATVREDYSADGAVWQHLPFEESHARAYRWGEDGLMGFTDRECRLCLGVALWNGNDPILKERLFGLTGPQGNHGEDVKERYWYLDGSPSHSYNKAAYHYPQAAFPYDRLREENARRDKTDLEFEIDDTGVFDGDRFFDVVTEYAKAAPNDLLMRVTVTNRGPDRATCHVLPQLWFRNTWTWGCEHEGCSGRPVVFAETGELGRRTAGHGGGGADPPRDQVWQLRHDTLGPFTCFVGDGPDGTPPRPLFTENETSTDVLYGDPEPSPHTKAAFHQQVVGGDPQACNPELVGTKAAAWHEISLAAGESATVRLRLCGHVDSTGATLPVPETCASALGEDFDAVFRDRIADCDAYYDSIIPAHVDDEQRLVSRQAYAGLLWTKQFYHYIVRVWLEGDPKMPDPPKQRMEGRNRDWAGHFYARDVLSMPDKWEYPWFAAWDTAFHMIPFCRVDPWFAKGQLELLLREWYMHPNGQIPAYEFAFGDVNPPVHAWAAWRVYKMTAPRGQRDRRFLASCFQKCLLNFTWWVNRKDPNGENIFAGGFLGLDNIGVFDRSQKLPGDATLAQSDGTAWVAFYCLTMLEMALELADCESHEAAAYQDMASKFFEHFVLIVDAANRLGGDQTPLTGGSVIPTPSAAEGVEADGAAEQDSGEGGSNRGLWDSRDGFYYDHLRIDGQHQPLRVRSLVGLIPLAAVAALDRDQIDRLPGFKSRMEWFLRHRPDLADHVVLTERRDTPRGGCTERSDGVLLLAMPSEEQLRQVLKYLFDETEFLSPYGIRSMSRYHQDHPFELDLHGQAYEVAYAPAESTTRMFGGNSNWRGPIWFPTAYLLIEALQRYHHFYGDSLTVRVPTQGGPEMNLLEASLELERRMTRLCRPDAEGRTLFHEYFHADNGRGCGASHQTGWTALIAKMIQRPPLTVEADA